MNLAHTVARNIALQKAGLGFLAYQRRTPVPTASASRLYEAPTLQLHAKHGRTEAGECKISWCRRR